MKGLRLIHLLAVIAVAFAALLAIAAAVLVSLDLSTYRGELEARVGETLGRPVTLNGPIHIEPSIWPTITALDVAILNPDWATGPRLAEADRLSLQFGLLQLLRGQVVIRRVILSGARLHLETRADGTANWMISFARRSGIGGGSDESLTSLPQIEVRKSSVDFRDGRSGVVTRLTVTAALLSAELNRPLELAFDGSLRGMPITLGVAGGPVGELVQGDAAWPVRIAFVINAAQVQASGTMTRLPEPRFDLQVHAVGPAFDTLSGLLGVSLPALGSFELNAQVRRDASGYELSRLEGFLGGDGSNQRMVVHDGRLTAPYDAPVNLDVWGTYRSEPFELQLSGGAYPALLRDSADWPLNAHVHVAHTQASLEGTVQPSSGDFTVDVQAAGKALSSLNAVAGGRLPSVGPYDLRTRLSRQGETLSFQGLTLHVGQSDLRGAVDVALGGPRPVLSGHLESSTIDLSDFDRALAAASDGGSKLAARIPPNRRPLPTGDLGALEADLDVSVGRVLGAEGRIEEIHARLRLHDGDLRATNVSVRLAGQDVTGALGYAQSNGQPHIRIEAHGRSIAYGPVLAVLGITDQLSGTAERLDYYLDGSGQTFQDVLQNSAMRLEATRGTLTHTSRRTGRTFSFSIDQGKATLGGGKGLELAAQGRYRDQPYELKLSGDGFHELDDDTTLWHARATGTVAGIEVGVEGAMRAVFDGAGVDLTLSASGAHLAALNGIFGINLPALGAFSARGHLTDTADGLHVDGVTASLGQSDFSGDVRIVSGNRPRATVTLHSKLLRSADLEAPKPPLVFAAPPERLIPDVAFDTDRLRSFDMDFSYRVDQVAFSKTELRSLAVKGQLRQGDLQVRSITGSLWNGTLQGSFELNASTTPPKAHLNVTVKGFDYAQPFGSLGAVGIRDVNGQIAVDLTGQGNSVRDALGDANGAMEFYGDSGEIDNRFLDWWGSDLILGLVPDLLKKRTSAEVACTVGHFDVKAGRAETKSLLVDVERIVIKGAGTIDLKNESVDLLIWPESRDRSVASLTTPVRISGPLSAPSVRPQASGILENVAWLVLGANNPPMLLLGWIGSGNLEEQPCGIAVKSVDGQAPPQDFSPPNPFSKFKDMLRGLGRSITKPFESK